MSNSSSTWVSRPTTVVAGLRARLVQRARLEHLVAGQRVGDVAGQRELLDALRAAGCAAAAPARRLVSIASGDARRCSSSGRPCDGGGARGPRGPGESYAGSPARGRPRRSRAAPARVRIGWVRLASAAASSRAAGPSSRSRGRRQPGRHLVDRRRGDHQHAEEREQHEQRHHDVRRAQQVEQQAGDDVADRAAALPERAGVTERRLRVAGGDVDDAEHAEGQRRPSR